MSDIQTRTRQTGLEIIHLYSLLPNTLAYWVIQKQINPKQYQCRCELPGSFTGEITGRFYTQADYC